MTKLRCVTIALGVILIITMMTVCGIKSITANSAEPQNQWEYLVVAGGQTNLLPTANSSMRKDNTGSFSREQFPVEQNLDKLGTKGWELITVNGTAADPIYYFKRHKN